MKSRLWLWGIAISLCAMVALSSQLFAQANPQHHPRHQQYTLYDVGTFGGPISEGSWTATSITAAGAIGFADTTLFDPFYPNCFFDCYVAHAYLWRRGHTTDLGALPGNNGGNSSWAWAINNSGLVVGLSEDGNIDPDTGYPSVRPVAWLNGHIFNLGGFGGTQNFANMVNDRGQIVGASSNKVLDPYAFAPVFPSTTQVRAFVWEGGWMRDIGTLGGPDAMPVTIAQSGVVVGFSYTSFTPNPDSGVPTIDPFLWDGRRMIDLGGFGGTYGRAEWVNNNGQVVGYSDLPGDLSSHGFLWDHGVLRELLPLAGMTDSFAAWINDAGTVTGESYVPGGNGWIGSAVLWNHGQITALGRLPGDDEAVGISINNAQQLVGYSCLEPCNNLYVERAFLWENGDMVDLNALVQPSSDLVVANPMEINDRGEIAAEAVLPDGTFHSVVLVPTGDCDSSCEQRIAESRNNPRAVQPMNKRIPIPRFGKPSDVLRNPFGRVPGMPGSGAFLAH